MQLPLHCKILIAFSYGSLFGLCLLQSSDDSTQLNQKDWLLKVTNNGLDEFGKPNDVIHEGDNKILVFTTQKYKITCVRKFTINKKGIISGFNSRNCF